jgi:stage IV sporulation protein FB
MFMTEPQRSPYDLHFSVAGIPVRVHPWFWLVSVLLGMNLRDPKLVLVWIGVVFVSILVHELGHAITARAQGWEPWITLYGMGGLASYRPTFYRPWTQVLISFAGPLAGFLLAGLVILLVVVSGHSSDFFGWTFGNGPHLAERSRVAFIVVFLALQVNIFWGLINLLPVLPLDGGRIARELLSMVNPRDGNRHALFLSMFTATGLAIFGLLKLESVFMGIFFGWMAYNSYQALQFGGGGGFGGDGGGRWR